MREVEQRSARVAEDPESPPMRRRKRQSAEGGPRDNTRDRGPRRRGWQTAPAAATTPRPAGERAMANAFAKWRKLSVREIAAKQMGRVLCVAQSTPRDERDTQGDAVGLSCVA
jgi:hypothetical protein